MPAAQRGKGIQVAVVETELQGNDENNGLQGEVRQHHVGAARGAVVPKADPDATKERQCDQPVFQQKENEALWRDVLVENPDHCLEIPYIGQSISATTLFAAKDGCIAAEHRPKMCAQKRVSIPSAVECSFHSMRRAKPS